MSIGCFGPFICWTVLPSSLLSSFDFHAVYQITGTVDCAEGNLLALGEATGDLHPVRIVDADLHGSLNETAILDDVDKVAHALGAQSFPRNAKHVGMALGGNGEADIGI